MKIKVEYTSGKESEYIKLDSLEELKEFIIKQIPSSICVRVTNNNLEILIIDSELNGE